MGDVHSAHTVLALRLLIFEFSSLIYIPYLNKVRHVVSGMAWHGGGVFFIRGQKKKRDHGWFTRQLDICVCCLLFWRGMAKVVQHFPRY